MTRNPFADREKILGLNPGNFRAAKVMAENYLKANDDKEQVDEALVRAAVTPSVSDRVWNEIKKDLGLVLALFVLLGGCTSTYLTRCFWTQEQAVMICITEEAKQAHRGGTHVPDLPEIVDPGAS